MSQHFSSHSIMQNYTRFAASIRVELGCEREEVKVAVGVDTRVSGWLLAGIGI